MSDEWTPEEITRLKQLCAVTKRNEEWIAEQFDDESVARRERSSQRILAAVFIASVLLTALVIVVAATKQRERVRALPTGAWDVIGVQEDGATRVGCISDAKPPAVMGEPGFAAPRDPRPQILVMCFDQGGQSVRCESPLVEESAEVTRRCR